MDDHFTDDRFKNENDKAKAAHGAFLAERQRKPSTKRFGNLLLIFCWSSNILLMTDTIPRRLIRSKPGR